MIFGSLTAFDCALLFVALFVRRITSVGKLTAFEKSDHRLHFATHG